jgi:adenylate cyclase
MAVAPEMHETVDRPRRLDLRRGGVCALPFVATHGWEAALEGDIRKVSVVMADLRGFTTFCERVPLGLMSRVLNEYLAAMMEVLFKHHGRVQDFVGDGILGVFGAPGLDPDHVWHAVLSALEMQVTIRSLSDRWEREVGTSFTLGVAVHTGEVFAGAVGSPRHMKYAVIGDPVNTVARLEEVNRSLGTEIVMSGDALAAVRARVEIQPRGAFFMRGRSHAVEVFEVLGSRHTPWPLTNAGDVA